jgi:hypothetical protein
VAELTALLGADRGGGEAAGVDAEIEGGFDGVTVIDPEPLHASISTVRSAAPWCEGRSVVETSGDATLDSPCAAPR